MMMVALAPSSACQAPLMFPCVAVGIRVASEAPKLGPHGPSCPAEPRTVPDEDQDALASLGGEAAGDCVCDSVIPENVGGGGRTGTERLTGTEQLSGTRRSV